MAFAQKYAVPPGAAAAQEGLGAPAPMAAAPPLAHVTPYQPAIQLGGKQPAIGQQPGLQQIHWMPAPQAVAGCPPGLEYLTQIDQLLVHQQIELFDVFTDIETVNRYQINNSLGQQVYFAHEESEFCERQCCGATRGFQMHITDNHNQEVLRLSREFKCFGGCCWCANMDCVALDIAVEAPIGNVIGYVRQEQSWWYPNFTVLNPAKRPVLKIRGPSRYCQNVCCTEDNDFLIMDENKTAELGKLSKQLGGTFKDAYTIALTFPTDLSVEMKACLLGSVFMIDFMFFELPENYNEGAVHKASTMTSAQKYGVPPGAGAAQGGFGAPTPMAAAPPQGYVTPYQPAIQLGGIQPAIGQQQPGLQQINWMPAPQAVAGCPPGLEYLTQIDQLLVHQQIELFEVFTDIETVNRYQIKNSLGQQVYFAHEDSGFCMRQCCGARRGFQMHITDNHDQEVLRLSREFKCCGGCCWCANLDCVALDIAVEAPVGNVIGYVRQSQSWWYPNFTVLNPAKEPVLKIRGPFWFCQNVCCTDDIDFLIMDENKTAELGKLSKQWGGIFKEAYTNADNFALTFPTDLSVEMKACLLGSVFLIDFMFFEHPKNNNQH